MSNHTTNQIEKNRAEESIIESINSLFIVKEKIK